MPRRNEERSVRARMLLKESNLAAKSVASAKGAVYTKKTARPACKEGEGRRCLVHRQPSGGLVWPAPVPTRGNYPLSPRSPHAATAPVVI